MATLVTYKGKEICFMNEDAFRAFQQLLADYKQLKEKIGTTLRHLEGAENDIIDARGQLEQGQMGLWERE